MLCVNTPMKTLTALSLLTLTLTACGGSGNAPAPSEKDSDPPVINLIVPAADERTNVVIKATATDQNGVKSVTFVIQPGGSKPSQTIEDKEAPFEVNLGKLPAGSIGVHAFAVDSLGNRSQDDYDSLTITEAHTTVDQDIMTDTVWTADKSPYVMTKALNVDEKATLTIEPGVIVRGGDLRTYGRVNAIGTAENPVHFEGYVGGPYKPLASTGPATVTLRHAIIKGGLFLDSSYSRGTLVVEDSVFQQQSGYGSLSLYSDTTVVLRRNVFHSGIAFSSVIPTSFPATIENNLFLLDTAWIGIDGYDGRGSINFTKNTLLLGDGQEPNIRLDGFFGRGRTTPYEIHFKGNYLGGATQSEIDAAIYDAKDDRELIGRLYFDENLTAPDPATPKL